LEFKSVHLELADNVGLLAAVAVLAVLKLIDGLRLNKLFYCFTLISKPLLRQADVVRSF
jgi:hypothetical protein